MNYFSLIFLLLLVINNSVAQNSKHSTFISTQDMHFLDELTKDVLEASRIYPNQFISEAFGANKTGETVIRPGGKNAYPSFWIRDYAMSLETGLVSLKEQLHMILLTASTQADQAWITKGGSLVPAGSIADHIRIDNSQPIYFPGTYSFEEQGTAEWGKLPPYCDQFYFVHMVHYYVKKTNDYQFLLKEINGLRLIDRLKLAFHVPPSTSTHLVYATEALRGVDFGFRDAQTITGQLCFPSLLKYQAANQLAEMLRNLKRQEADKYIAIARSIKENIPLVFMDERGMLRASTERSQQADVWSTALAIYWGILEGENLNKSTQMLTKAYKDGTLSYKGNIRHVLTTDDFNEKTAWELSLSPKNTYQNGSYWGTPTGWVCYAISKVDRTAAQSLANEYIDELRENDFRKGESFGAPYECFNKEGITQNPVYLTSVACSLVVFKKLNP
jgi:hypothetical protein